MSLGKGMESRPAITRGLLERSHGRAAGVHVPTSNDLLTGRVSRYCPLSRNQLLLAVSSTLIYTSVRTAISLAVEIK